MKLKSPHAILIVALLTITIPVSANYVAPQYHAVATMSPSDCFQPNCEITYTVIFGCGGSAYSPGYCPDDWEIAMAWDPRYMEYIGEWGCMTDNPFFEEENGLKIFACNTGETFGSTSVTLKIKESTPSYVSPLNVFINARNWDDWDHILFSFVRTMRQNDQNGWYGIERPAYFVPEFPSTFLPAIVIVGFLGAVLLIKRTREN